MRSPGLLGRTLVASVLVAAVAVVATAMLAVSTTRGSIEREQVRVSDSDRAVVAGLLEHGRTHPSWSGLGDLLQRVAGTDRSVLLTDLDGRRLAGHGPGAGLAAPAGAGDDSTADPSAVVGPLGSVLEDVVDDPPTRPGRLALPTSFLEDRAGAEGLRLDVATYPRVGVCDGVEAVWVPEVPVPLATYTECSALVPDDAALGSGPAAELAALANEVAVAERSCLARRGVESGLARWFAARGTGAPDLVTVSLLSKDKPTDTTRRAWRDCATAVLTRALRPLVAPDALVYLTESRPTSRSLFERFGGVRIVLALGVVLLAAVAASALAARRVVRPVTELTAAAQEMSRGDLAARVPVSGGHEVARLGRAFNEMADALADADEQRRRMVDDVAHELRTPLANIRGYLEAGQDGVLERDDAWTASLVEEAELLQHVVDDLQVLARADAGQLSVDRDATDLGTTVTTAVQAVAGRADAAGVSLVQLGRPPVDVPHDARRIRQVVGNLLSNAVRHSPAGGTVTVTLGGTGRRARIEVRDTGPGIGAQHLPHVFERFYRADPSRTRGTGGSGLGLAIVDQLVRAHGGMVTAADHPDGGAVLTVELPAAD